MDEQQRTQILLTLCIELTLCAPGKQEAKGEDDLQDQNHKEILGLLQVLQWRINSLKHGKSERSKESQGPIQISQKEFDKLYNEWLVRKGINVNHDRDLTNLHCMLQVNKGLCLNDIKVQVSTILAKLGANDANEWITMVELLNS